MPYPLDPVRNVALCTVGAGYNETATTIVLASGHGSKLPNPATEGAFNLNWWDGTTYAYPGSDPKFEIVRCTARTNDTLTITRAQEGTTAQTHNTTGKTYYMLLGFTKKMLDDIGTIFAVLDGKSGGQHQYGGIAASENLYLSSTKHATKAKIYLGTLSAYDELNDRLGLGITTPGTKLHVLDALTNIGAGIYASGNVDQRAGVTINGTYYNKAMLFACYPNILTGITNSGYAIGFHGSALRNFQPANTDEGTLSILRGGWIQYGHFNTVGGNAPATTTMYGLHLCPLAHTGTIGTLYDLFIEAKAGAIVPGTHYAIYQQSSVPLNYFGGFSTFGMGIDLAAGKVYKVSGVQVVGARVIDARLDDAINSGDATTDGVIDALRDLVLAHGLGAVA